MKKAIITVLGKDSVGIIYNVAKILSENNINILDISQTIMDDIFTMVMSVDLTGSAVDFKTLSALLDEKGEELSVKIILCLEETFNSMHRI